MQGLQGMLEPWYKEYKLWQALMFRHPKYYKELRKLRNKSDQAISDEASTEATSVRSGPGLKQQAIEETVPHNDIEEASSAKPQAPSESNNKLQAPSPKHEASSSKPQASSSKIWEPRKSFTVPEPRCWTMINVLVGCFTWNAIWCGLKRTLLHFVNFNSTVKEWRELL